MAWEKRGNGRQYFYLSERLPDGRVRKRYFGNGLRAEVESMRLEKKERQRQQLCKERQATLELESLTKQGAESIRTVMDASLYAAGFHNPQSRGWRRRREMIRPVEANEQESQPHALQEAETEEITLGELVSRCRRGDRQAARKRREVLNEHPDLFHGLGQVAQKVKVQWIRVITGSDLFEREMVLRATQQLRQSLIEEGTGTQLDRLVVEQVINSHLQQAFHETREPGSASMGLGVSKYRLDAVERASRRHLKALATLRSMTSKLAQDEQHCLAVPPGTPRGLTPESSGHPGCNRLSGSFDSHGGALVAH